MKPDLSRIAHLTAAELRGWWLAVCVWRVRPEEPGERGMLLGQAKTLGLEVK